MVGDQERAKRAIVGYISAQLQSGLVAMEAALTLKEPELSFRAAQKYIELADLARQLYTTQDTSEIILSQQTHNWAALLQAAKELPNVAARRTQRLPRVRGDAEVQSAIVKEVLAHISASRLLITFRQRGDDLVVACRGAHEIPEELLVAGSRNALFTAARQTSLAAIRGYLLARRCEAAGIRVVVTRGVIFLHFEVVRQLKIPL